MHFNPGVYALSSLYIFTLYLHYFSVRKSVQRILLLFSYFLCSAFLLYSHGTGIAFVPTLLFCLYQFSQKNEAVSLHGLLVVGFLILFASFPFTRTNFFMLTLFSVYSVVVYKGVKHKSEWVGILLAVFMTIGFILSQIQQSQLIFFDLLIPFSLLIFVQVLFLTGPYERAVPVFKSFFLRDYLCPFAIALLLHHYSISEATFPFVVTGFSVLLAFLFLKEISNFSLSRAKDWLIVQGIYRIQLFFMLGVSWVNSELNLEEISLSISSLYLCFLGLGYFFDRSGQLATPPSRSLFTVGKNLIAIWFLLNLLNFPLSAGQLTGIGISRLFQSEGWESLCILPIWILSAALLASVKGQQNRSERQSDWRGLVGLILLFLLPQILIHLFHGQKIEF